MQKISNTLLQIWNQFVDYVLHCSVKAYVLQRMRLMDCDVAGWTSGIVFQVLY